MSIINWPPFRTKKECSIDDLSADEILCSSKFPYCKVHKLERTIHILREARKQGIDKIEIRPIIDKAFNSGYFTEQDVRDWAKGKGPIIKGRNEKEMQKYIYYAMVKGKISYKVEMYWDHMHYLDNAEILEDKRSSNLYSEVKEVPDKKHALLDISASISDRLFRDISHTFSYERPKMPSTSEEWKLFSNILRDWEKKVIGSISVLYYMRLGYYGAVNSPEEPRNLSWLQELIVAHALKRFYDERMELPDYDFINKNK